MGVGGTGFKKRRRVGGWEGGREGGVGRVEGREGRSEGRGRSEKEKADHCPSNWFLYIHIKKYPFMDNGMALGMCAVYIKVSSY